MKLFDSLAKRAMYKFGTSVKSKHVAAVLKCSTLTKAWNLALVSYGTWRGRTHSFGYPYVLMVEPTNRCNLECPLCPTGKGLMGRRHQEMSLERFQHTIDAIGKYVYLVNFQNWGEPTLARDVFAMIRYARDARIYTSLATNGNYSPKLTEQFLSSKLDHVTVALDGTDSETYVQYRRGGRFDLVVRNIRDIQALKAERRVRSPFVELQFLVFRHNEEQIASIRQVAEEIGADGLIVRAAESPDNGHVLERYYTWNNRKGFCPRFWYTVTVAVDGGLAPCCNYFHARDDFGNAFDTPFDSAWDGEEYRGARAAAAAADVDQLPSICRACKIYDTERVSYPIWNPEAADG